MLKNLRYKVLDSPPLIVPAAPQAPYGLAVGGAVRLIGSVKSVTPEVIVLTVSDGHTNEVTSRYGARSAYVDPLASHGFTPEPEVSKS